MEFKYDYTVSPDYDVEEYKKIKSRIKSHFPLFSVQEETIDSLDGDMIQVFKRGNDIIRVVNDYMVGAVYVESTVEISFLRS